jgi:hypothetical protein
MKIEMGVFNRVRTLSRNIRELGLIGTLRQRFRKGEPEFQILTARRETETTETATAPETVVGGGAGKKRIRGV